MDIWLIRFQGGDLNFLSVTGERPDERIGPIASRQEKKLTSSNREADVFPFFHPRIWWDILQTLK